jgi:DNA polymerase III alpha subunit (gram-positive type)
MANKRNIIVADCETTGLNPEKGCEIVQLSARAINAWNLEDHHAGCFNIILKPQRPDLAEDGALKVIGPKLWDEAQTNGIDPKVGLQQFMSWCEKVNDGKSAYSKPMICGHNIGFDLTFLNYWMIQYGLIKNRDDVPWNYAPLDTMTVCFLLFEADPMVENMKLDTFLKQIGIARSGQFHDSMEDVNLTTQALVRSMKFFRECRKRMRVQK